MWIAATALSKVGLEHLHHHRKLCRTAWSQAVLGSHVNDTSQGKWGTGYKAIKKETPGYMWAMLF